MTQTDKSRFTYLPVTEIVDRLGLYVTGVGSDVIPSGTEYPRQKHPELYDFSWATGRILPEFQFVFIAAGSGEFESAESGIKKVEAGTAFILFPDVWHRYRPDPATGWKEYWVSLGGDLLFQWHDRGLFSAEKPLTRLDEPQTTEDDYRELVELAIRSRETDALRLTACAMKVVASAFDGEQKLDIEASRLRNDHEPTDDAVRQALHMIWNHSHQRVSIDRIAKQIGVNRRTLERRFRQHLGRTLLQELVSCRIQRAKRLLRETHVPIKYVAYAAGFSSLSNLCKVFRREVGLTPGEYRESVTK